MLANLSNPLWALRWDTIRRRCRKWSTRRVCKIACPEKRADLNQEILLNAWRLFRAKMIADQWHRDDEAQIVRRALWAIDRHGPYRLSALRPVALPPGAGASHGSALDARRHPCEAAPLAMDVKDWRAKLGSVFGDLVAHLEDGGNYKDFALGHGGTDSDAKRLARKLRASWARRERQNRAEPILAV